MCKNVIKSTDMTEHTDIPAIQYLVERTTKYWNSCIYIQIKQIILSRKRFKAQLKLFEIDDQDFVINRRLATFIRR